MDVDDYDDLLYPTPRAYYAPPFLVKTGDSGLDTKMMIELTFKECLGLYRSERRFCQRIVKTDALYDHFNTMKVEKNKFLLLFHNDGQHSTLQSSMVGFIADSWMNKYDRLMMIVEIIDVVIPLMKHFLSDALTLIADVVEELDKSLELMPNLKDEYPFTIDVMRTKMKDGIYKVLKDYNNTYQLAEEQLLKIKMDMPRLLKNPKFLSLWVCQKSQKVNGADEWCRTKEYTFQILEDENSHNIQEGVVLETATPSSTKVVVTMKQVHDDEALTQNDDNLSVPN